jgi:hypothetical protein
MGGRGGHVRDAGDEVIPDRYTASRGPERARNLARTPTRRPMSD